MDATKLNVLEAVPWLPPAPLLLPPTLLPSPPPPSARTRSGGTPRWYHSLMHGVWGAATKGGSATRGAHSHTPGHPGGEGLPPASPAAGSAAVHTCTMLLGNLLDFPLHGIVVCSDRVDRVGSRVLKLPKHWQKVEPAGALPRLAWRRCLQ